MVSPECVDVLKKRLKYKEQTHAALGNTKMKQCSNISINGTIYEQIEDL